MLEERRDLDAVVVLAPNFLHAEASVAALERGLHVFCEKPMATTMPDANRMIAAAARTGKVLQIGFQMRYSPLYRALAEVVRSGEIGPLQFISGSRFRGDWNPESWKYNGTNWRYLTHTAGSSLLEDGIHEIDVLHGIAGSQVVRVFASGGSAVYKGRETIDHAAVVVEYENGIKFEFGYSLFGNNSGPDGLRMLLIGTRGNTQPIGHRIAVRQSAGGEARMIAPAVDDGIRAEWLAFANSVRTGARPLADGESAKQPVKIALLAEKSIREKRVVAWGDLPA
jgi:myo-inositol 2-dehydrogenase/D-chiro-inositol 1-dehydrogenase